MQDSNKDMEVRERLVSLETKLAFIQNLLEEIKRDLKDQPSKEHVEELEERIQKLEKSQNKVVIKVGIISGILGTLCGFLFKIFLL